MSEAPAEAAAPSTALAVVHDLVTTSNVAIFDSAAFSQMKQVAVIMADSGLMSETFLKDGTEDAPRAMVVARCLMVADVAREVGANPLMFLQVCSIISRKLHIEGKAVNAIVKARTGVELEFRFGRYETDHIVFPEYVKDPDTGEDTDELVDPEFFHGLGDRLAVHVFDPERPMRFVEGSVAMWKTERKGSPWTNPGNWRRQLRYRGSPEWARAYEPGAILGIYTDADGDLGDEFEVIGRTPRPKRNLVEKLNGGDAAKAPEGQGFNRQHVADETGEERKDAAHDVVECDHEFEKIGDDERVCKHCGALPEDVADETPENSEEAQQRAVTQEETRPDLEADAAFLADLSGEETDVVLSRLQASDKAGDKLAENPQAETGETYLLAGDEFTGKDKRRVTYRDGVAFSSVGPQGAAKLKVYAIHAEVPEEEEKPAGGPAAEGAGEAAIQEAEAETEAGDPIADMVAAKFGAMTTWPEIKAEWAVMCKTTDWVGASPQDQDAIRRATWPLLAKLSVDQSQDVTAFGVWMPTQKGREGADAIKGTFDVLKRSDVWAKLTPAQVDTLENRVAATVAGLK